MPTLVILLATALSLGALHSLAPDHLAAVSVFLSRRPSWQRAAGIGARWAIGHSVTILSLGGAVVLTGLHLPDRLTPLVERVVGATLIVLGMVTVVRAARLHGHWHGHDETHHWHLHAHRGAPGHDHSHYALVGIGMLHGLAGSGALVIALPAMSTSRAHSLLFLAAFGVGTIVAMSLFSGVAGMLLAAATRRSLLVHRGAIALAGLCSMVVGVWWISAGGD